MTFLPGLFPTLASVTTVLLMTLFILVSLLMVGVILIQRPKGGGLAGAFGGAGGSAEAAFGSRTGDVLTWFTVALFIIFLATAIGLNLLISPPEASSPVVTTPPAAATTQEVEVPVPPVPETVLPEETQPVDLPAAAPAVEPTPEPAAAPPAQEGES